MLIWDQSQDLCKQLSGDGSASALTGFKRDMNLGYKYILADLGRTVGEREKTGSTVASQQAYQVPPDFLWTKAVKITVGSTTYPLVEEESQEMWDYRNVQTTTSDTPQLYFVRPRFGVGGTEILIWPTPSSAGNTIKITYEATDRDLSVDKYTTGTVALTNGSATVTGTGTTFTKAMIGRYFQVTDDDGDKLWYRVADRTSATALTLENVYEGETDATVNYQIAEAFNLPEELQVLPVHYAMAMFFSGKGNEKKADKHTTSFNVGLRAAQRRYGTKSRSNIIRPKRHNSRFSYPVNFPSQITG